MITGYNTDVRYQDLVLHVQTEDKGHANPFIESLIYYGGQVVVAKRASYAELLQNAGGDQAVLAFMDRQHRSMIQAIRDGKYDEKIRAYAPEKADKDTREEVAQLALAEDGGRTLDQVILEYLTTEAEQEQLLLVMEEEVELVGGGRAELALRARSSKSGQGAAGARVQVKMISTAGGPQTLASGQTDDEGYLRLTIEIPAVDRGTAAMIVTAASAFGQAELKYLL